MVVEYSLTEDIFAKYHSEVCLMLKGQTSAYSVLEVGAGANPLFSLRDIDSMGIRYCCLDISKDEIEKAGPGYRFFLGDIGDKNCVVEEKFDLVFSQMLAEHIRNGEIFHKNVSRFLKVGGRAIHLFPTLFAPPFVANRLLPERLSEWVVGIVQPGSRARAGRQGKFPAYYSWCFGPIALQVSRFKRVGFRVDKYSSFFGHDGYYTRFATLRAMHRKVAKFLVRNPSPIFTSFAIVQMTKVE